MNKQAAKTLNDWYGGVNPELKAALIRGLAGAAIGGAATGGIAAATPHDPGERNPVMGPAITGALMGGTAAAALPIAGKLLGGGIHFSQEKRRPATARTIEAITSPVLSHPLAFGLGGAATWGARDAIPVVYQGMSENEGQGSAFSRLRSVLKDDARWDRASRGVRSGVQMTEAEIAKLPQIMGRASKGRLAAIPIAVILGAIGDKYLKGEY